MNNQEPDRRTRKAGGGRKPKGNRSGTLHMPEGAWKELDRRRGAQPRGDFIAALLAGTEEAGDGKGK